MKKNNFLVSIVIPIYNMDDSIERSVKSIINQEYKNIEIILIDDGSSDDSLLICNKLAKNDNRIKVFHTENRGSGPARNLGIEKSNGEYIYFPDADDVLSSNAISVLVDATEDMKYDLIVFGYKSIGKSNRVFLEKKYELSCQKGADIRKSYGEYMTTSAKWGIQGAPWNKFFNSRIIKSNNIEYPSLRRHQDEAFIGRYMCYANYVKFIPDILYTHYTNDLKKEWQKYPKDYIESVIGLYKIRNETILKWNTKDLTTLQIINCSYINNIIKALELSFSPKYNFNFNQRYMWIIEKIKMSNLCNVEINNRLGKYQKCIYKLSLRKKYRLVYIVLKFKVSVEKSKILNMIRSK